MELITLQMYYWFMNNNVLLVQDEAKRAKEWNGGWWVYNLRSSLGEVWDRPPYKEEEERPKKQAGRSRWLHHDAVSKGTSLWGLSWQPQGKEISASVHRSLTRLYWGPNWGSVMCSVQMSSVTHYSLRLHPWKWLPVWKQWAECTSQAQGRGEEPPVAQGQLLGQLIVISSPWPPPTEIQSLSHDEGCMFKSAGNL